MNSALKANPALAGMSKFQSKLAVSDKAGVKGLINQVGINMVDLMMWLVIAALLLAAAIQGIGYYQQAAWTYQARSDVASVRTYMEAQFTLSDNKYPNQAQVTADITSKNLSLTSGNTVLVRATTTSGWEATITSKGLDDSGNDTKKFFNFSSVQTTNNVQGTGTATVTAGV